MSDLAPAERRTIYTGPHLVSANPTPIIAYLVLPGLFTQKKTGRALLRTAIKLVALVGAPQGSGESSRKLSRPIEFNNAYCALRGVPDPTFGELYVFVSDKDGASWLASYYNSLRARAL